MLNRAQYPAKANYLVKYLTYFYCVASWEKLTDYVVQNKSIIIINNKTNYVIIIS